MEEQWKIALSAICDMYKEVGLKPYVFNGASRNRSYEEPYPPHSGYIILCADGTYSVSNCLTDERCDGLSEDEVAVGLGRLQIENAGWQ